MGVLAAAHAASTTSVSVSRIPISSSPSACSCPSLRKSAASTAEFGSGGLSTSVVGSVSSTASYVSAKTSQHCSKSPTPEWRAMLTAGIPAPTTPMKPLLAARHSVPPGLVTRVRMHAPSACIVAAKASARASTGASRMSVTSTSAACSAKALPLAFEPPAAMYPETWRKMVGHSPALTCCSSSGGTCESTSSTARCTSVIDEVPPTVFPPSTASETGPCTAASRSARKVFTSASSNASRRAA
mmetsp:Transcript_22299/g.72333  ORF Transcript_22299/g.72333 Transcript_22299/m.72333 type:complete len:243 (+) Transcript_22299:1086-1814(+)